MIKVSLMAGVLLMAASIWAKEKTALPALITNATYVFVTTYDGDLVNPEVTPEDRHAVDDIQNALEKWGRYKLVYKLQEADLILVVRTGRALEIKGGIQKSTTTTSVASSGGSAQMIGGEVGDSRDSLAVYTASQGEQSMPLWRNRAANGLKGPEIPLLKEFQAKVEASRKKP
jgi:hypothetical protein